MKILLDCDGILADFVRATFAELENGKGYIFREEDVTQHNMLKCLGLDPETVEWLSERWKDEGFCAGILPYPDAFSGVFRLSEIGDIVTVTAPLPGSKTWASERIEWLRHHFGLTSVVSTKEKQHVIGDVLIDDDFRHLIGSPCAKKIMFRRPWNEADVDACKAADIAVVGTWEELVLELRGAQ